MPIKKRKPQGRELKNCAGELNETFNATMETCAEIIGTDDLDCVFIVRRGDESYTVANIQGANGLIDLLQSIISKSGGYHRVCDEKP